MVLPYLFILLELQNTNNRLAKSYFQSMQKKKGEGAQNDEKRVID